MSSTKRRPPHDRTWSQPALERAILQAHESGDKTRLEELQAAYRASGFSAIRVGGTCQIKESSSRGASARSAESADYDVQLRDELDSRWAVYWKDWAWDSLRDIAFWSSIDGQENGGSLFGVEYDYSFAITSIAKTEAQDSRSNHSVRIDTSRAEQKLEARGNGVERVIGDAHTHVDEDRAPRPSPADLRGWAARVKPGEPYLGVIVNPERDEICAWAVHLEDGRYVADPVRVGAR